MKKLWLLLFVLLPAFCNAQDFLSGKLAENRVDEATNDTIKRTYWQVLQRGGLSRKLNTYYRFSSINGSVSLDLKVVEGGGVFVVARNSELKLMLESGDILVLHNSAYGVSCIGCGARGYEGTSAQGITLSFPMNKEDQRTLMNSFIAMVGVNSGEDYLEKKVNSAHSELLVDELMLVYEGR